MTPTTPKTSTERPECVPPSNRPPVRLITGSACILNMVHSARKREVETTANISITDVVDNCKLGPFQIRLLALCTLCLIMDGFDVQAVGYVAPAIIQAWNVS